MATLHSLNALRVIAEFFVVRQHIMPLHIGMDMFVRDLMSFFFVLSGFVLMYTYYDRKFGSKQDILDFWYGRAWKLYPTYLVCLTFQIPLVFMSAMDLPNKCVYDVVCPALQPFFLNCWAGCGILFIINSPSWYLSVLVWFWLAFPVFKDYIFNLFLRRHLAKMVVISILWTALIVPFHEYDVFTLCTLPLLRLGEFLIGCGCACSVKGQDANNIRIVTRIPAMVSVVYFALFHGLLSFPHPFESLCLHADIHTATECSVWRKSVWIPSSTPCRTVFDKYFNTHALLWAAIIHYVASLEVKQSTGFLTQFLGHGIFKTLSTFSIAVYLGHMDMKYFLIGVPDLIFGWGDIWTYDLLILCVYAMCYLLHITIQVGGGLCSRCRRPLTEAPTSDSP
jgi:hypothetical protein